MKNTPKIFIFLIMLSVSSPSYAASGTEEIMKLTEKYIKICRTNDINTITPSLIADGLNKEPRSSLPPKKKVGDWEFHVDVPKSKAHILQQEKNGRIETPFYCKIVAMLKSGNDQSDLSYVKSHFVPTLNKHLGTPTKTEDHSKNLYTALWCETSTAGMELRAKSQPENPRSSTIRNNTFTIGMSVFNETTNRPTNAISPCK